MTQSKTHVTSALFTVSNMAKIAILAAVAVILMMFEFPLPVAPSFYKFDFSEVPVLVGGFALGPMAAVVIEGVKIILNFLFTGTITMGVGELANFLIGCALCVPAAVFYKHNKTKTGAMKGLVLGTFCMCLVGVIMNYFVLIPAFVAIAHFPMEAILGAGQAIFPFIQNSFQFVIVCVTLFNLIKGIAVSVVTLLIYKSISPLLHK